MQYSVGIFLILFGVAECFIDNGNIHIYGSVAGGNFTYYSLLQKGPITLYLHTSKGDADLYISQFVVLPTYDPNQYCLHSASCGLDIVDIPPDFKRPVSIGVYGHPSYIESEFVLELKQKAFDEIDPFFDELSPSSEDLIDRYPDQEFSEEEEEEEYRRGGGVLVSFLLTLLDIILELFLL